MRAQSGLLGLRHDLCPTARDTASNGDEPRAYCPGIDVKWGKMGQNEAGLAADDRNLIPHLRIDAYNASAKPLRMAQRQLLHELTVGVLWPHRPRDLDLFLSLGEGYLAVDEMGRPLGSAMYFPTGDDFAMLGMMVTVPRLQARGAGKWLLQRVKADCVGRDLRLSATQSGYRLYTAAGFRPVGIIRQHQGITREIGAVDAPGILIRDLEAHDDASLRSLDAVAYGAMRTRVLDALRPLSIGTVALRDGAVSGFALKRDFGRGAVIGPVVADGDAMAKALIAPLIRANKGSFTRLDTPVDSDGFLSFLTDAGLLAYDTVTEMCIGPHRRAMAGAVTYGLASHSLG